MPPRQSFDEVMAQARAGLSAMIRRKDAAGMAAFRSVMAALDNACAVPPPEPPAGTAAEGIALAVPFGTAEVPRRQVSPDEVDHILSAEITMRTEQATALDQAQRDLDAALARYQAALLTRLRDGQVLGALPSRPR